MFFYSSNPRFPKQKIFLWKEAFTETIFVEFIFTIYRLENKLHKMYAKLQIDDVIIYILHFFFFDNMLED